MVNIDFGVLMFFRWFVLLKVLVFFVFVFVEVGVLCFMVIK